MSGAFEDSINRSYFFMLRKDLIQTFEGLGIADSLRVSRSYLAIERDKVDCDLFDFLDGRRTKRPTEYMSQYSFGEYRLADILRFTPPICKIKVITQCKQAVSYQLSQSIDFR